MALFSCLVTTRHTDIATCRSDDCVARFTASYHKLLRDDSGS